MALYRNWFLAIRPWSFTMTIISFFVGTALAAQEGALDWFHGGLALLATLLLHGGANYVNDYYDVKNGIDTVDSATFQCRPHPLLEGLIPAHHVRFLALILFGIASLIGLYLVYTAGPVILALGVVGLLAGITYTAPPFTYKHWAMGELSVLLLWGPLMVEGAYYIQRRTLGLRVLLVSLPFGLLVALVLLANNLRDRELDRARGIRTLGTLFSLGVGRGLYGVLMGIAYLGVTLLVIVGLLNPWALLALGTLPLALHLFFKTMSGGIPANADALTARLNTLFGILLLVGLFLGGR